MTDVAAASASPVPIKLAGREFRMSPLTYDDIGELDQYLRSRVIESARQSLPGDASPDQRAMTEESAIRVACELTWMSGKGAKMMSSLQGWARILWQGLRHNHPELKPEDVVKLLTDPRTLEHAQAEWKRINKGDAKPGKAGARGRGR